jgi:hypothetical protein
MCDVEEGKARLDAFSAEVHECLWFKQVDLFSAQTHISVDALKFCLCHGSAMTLAPLVEEHETGVVPCICVFAAGVSQADNEQCIITHFLS